MSETMGRAQQLAQKEGREAQWAQVELQMAAWSERVDRQLVQTPAQEREREVVHQRVMEYSR